MAGEAFQPLAFQPPPAFQTTLVPTLNTPALIRDVLFRAGEPTGDASEYYTQVIGYLNRAELTLASGGLEFEPTVHEAWRWHRSPNPGILILEPAWDVSFDVTHGSIYAYYAGASELEPPLILPRSPIGNVFVSDAEAYPEVVSTTPIGTIWDAPWVNDTGTIEGQLWKLVYYLRPDVLRILDPMRVLRTSDSQKPFEVSAISRLQMERHYPLPGLKMGAPEAYAVVGYNAIRFSRSTDRYMRVEYDHMLVPPVLYDAPESVPREPIEYRYTLADMALYYMLDDKNDNRRDNIGMQARQRITSMRQREKVIEARTASAYGKIYPRATNVAPR